VGTVANILRYVTTPDGSHHIVCQGRQRFRILEYVEGHACLVARVQLVAEPEDSSKEVEARFLQLKERALQALELLPQAPQELAGAVQNMASPGALADLIAGFIDIKPAEKQAVLETFDLVKRLDDVLALLAHRIEVMRLSREIEERTKTSMDDRQRKFMLREQMQAIQKELGETEGNAAEIEELEQAIAKAAMPAEVEEQARKELKRLARTQTSADTRWCARISTGWSSWPGPSRRPMR
jgi:ATP-dependent Lon protease